MEFVIVESNPAFIEKVQQDLQSKNKELPLTNSAREIADCISRMTGIYTQHTEIIPVNPLHILINIEGNLTGTKRQQQKEAEIIIWLRCAYKVANPIIIYSFQSNAQLLKQKPENLVINSNGCHYVQLPFDFSRLKNKKLKGVSNWHKLKQFLLPAFNAEKLRHREANKWGLLQLQYAHRLVSDHSPQPAHSLPADYDSIEELIFHFFYNDNAPAELQLQPYIEKYKKIYKPLFSGKGHKKFTILVIDDYKKWHDLYEEIFQCQITLESPKASAESPEDPLEKFILRILARIDTKPPDLVFLDLRLYEETTPTLEPGNYSGTQVLKAIKEIYKALPVIITTASNKVHYYKALHQLGCDSMWTKEGIDLKYTRESSLMNYFELLENVYKVASKHQTPVDRKIAKTDREIAYLNGHFDKQKEFIFNICQSFDKYDVIIADETILSQLQYLPAICLLLKLGEKYRKMSFIITKEIFSDFFHHSLHYTNSIIDTEQEAARIKAYILTKLYQWGCAPPYSYYQPGTNSHVPGLNHPNKKKGTGATSIKETAFSLIQQNIRLEIENYCNQSINILLLSNNESFLKWVNDHMKQADQRSLGNVTYMNGENWEEELHIRKLVQPSLELAATVLPGGYTI